MLILLLLVVRIDLIKQKLSCSEINHGFNITLDSPGKGLPEGIAFDNTTPTTLPGTYYNIETELSSLHYTSAEGHIISSPQTISFNNMIVKGNFFRVRNYLGMNKLFLIVY